MATTPAGDHDRKHVDRILNDHAKLAAPKFVACKATDASASCTNRLTAMTAADRFLPG
jgi:hypothetical protein